MASIAWLKPPAEVYDLGTPERVFHSLQMRAGTKALIWTLVILALVLSASLLAVKEYTRWVHISKHIWLYVGSVALAGCGFLLAMVYYARSFRRPRYVYAFYPTGLVVFRDRKWGFLAWNEIATFERDAVRPYLFTTNRVHVTLDHDFRDVTQLYKEIERRSTLFGGDPVSLEVTAQHIYSSTKEAGIWLQLILGMMLVMGAVAATIGFWDGLIHSFQEIPMVNHQDFLMLGGTVQSKRTVVSLSFGEIIPTKVEIPADKDSSTPASKLVLIPVGERYLIANVAPDFQGKTLVDGEVKYWDMQTGPQWEARQAALLQVQKDFAKWKDRFLPYQFDALYPIFAHGQVVAFGLGAAVMLGLVLLFRGLWQRSSAKAARSRLLPL